MPRSTAGKVDAIGYALIAPFYLFLLVFILAPIAANLALSLTNYDLMRADFVGLRNYLYMLDDEHFQASLRNTSIYTFFTLIFSMALGLAAAMLLRRARAGIGFYRVCVYLPYVASMVAVSMIWLWIYDPLGGLANAVLGLFRIQGVKWLYDSRYALGSIVVMSIWKVLGYNMIVYLAGLHAIPAYLYEAATIDGAGRLRRFAGITWPMLRPVTFFLFVTGLINSFKVFEQVQILTAGGPSNSTTTVVHQIYNRAFNEFAMGYAAALSVVLLAIVAGVTLANYRFGNQGQDLERADGMRGTTPHGAGGLVLLLLALLMIAPFAIMLSTSLKSDSELKSMGFSVLPREPSPGNYLTALARGNWPLYFWNSILVTCVTVAVSLLINSVGGYAFARLRFPGRDALFVLSLIGLMIPPQATMIPVFIILKNAPLAGGNDLFGQGGQGLINSYGGLILPYVAGSYGVFMFRQFFLNFPRALDDAATIDGLGRLRAFAYIYVPLSLQVFATLGALKATQTWNEYIWPLIITSGEGLRTVQLALSLFRDEYEVQWNYLMAATALITLPLVAVFLFSQKYFVEGIATTGLKA